jgi:hypothetical protein
MRALLALCAAMIAAAIIATGAAAAPVTVSIVGCVLVHGGQETVPAGSTVSFRFGWGTRTKELSELFLRTVTVSASVDGTPVANADSYWTDPVYTGTAWLTNWLYPTGVTLEAGDTMVLTFDAVLSHPVADGFGRPTPGGSIFGGPATCTVTGV